MRDCPRRELLREHDQSHDCLVAAPWSPSRGRHQAEGAMTVASDQTCVFTEVVIPCPYGELVAKAAMPRVFLVSSCAAQLSNDEVALLSVLNAGVPHEPRAGKPPGDRVLHLVGFLTCKAAADQICQLNKDCKLDAVAMDQKISELDESSARLKLCTSMYLPVCD